MLQIDVKLTRSAQTAATVGY